MGGNIEDRYWGPFFGGIFKGSLGRIFMAGKYYKTWDRRFLLEPNLWKHIAKITFRYDYRLKLFQKSPHDSLDFNPIIILFSIKTRVVTVIL